MFKKTICLVSFAALALAQDLNTVVGDVANANLGDVATQVQNAGASVASIAGDVPLLSSLTVGWGPREVVVTPSGDATGNDWLNGQSNVARETGTAADGEWSLLWSIENGDDYALYHQNNDFVVVDTSNGSQNNWGPNDGLDTEIGNGAEHLIDLVYANTEVNTVQGQSIVDWLSSVLNNDSVGGFLDNAGSQTVGQAVGNAAGQTTGQVQEAANAIADASADLGNQAGQAANLANQAVSAVSGNI